MEIVGKRIVEIRERELWKRNSTGKCAVIPMWKRDYCGNAIKPKSMMKFQCGKETVLEMQQNPKK